MTFEQWNKQVKHALIDKDMTNTQLSQEIGVSRMAVWLTVTGQGSQRVANLINDYLGLERINYAEMEKA